MPLAIEITSEEGLQTLESYDSPYLASTMRGRRADSRHSDKAIAARKQLTNRKIENANTVEVLNLEQSPSWLAKNLGRLFGMRGLPVIWDDSGAALPNKRAMDLSVRMLSRLAELDFEPNFVDPSVNEGVSISFRRNGRYANIECFNSGELVAATSLDNGGTNVWEFQADESSIRETVNIVFAFING
jgi:hypothetical protein